jgi:uncharacterized protein (DUF488 family)
MAPGHRARRRSRGRSVISAPGSSPPLYSIGHSNHGAAAFLDLLRQHRIELVADVRSRPYSCFVPHFSKETLERVLAEEGVGYLFLGQELGGKPPRDNPTRFAPDYQARVRDPGFKRGIERLLEAARARRTALLCRERDPLDCHRLHLVCRYVRGMVGPIRHILPDGGIEGQATTERRLLERLHGRQPTLFDAASDEAALDLAYDRWWHPPGP